jgi:hypothetical protein
MYDLETQVKVAALRAKAIAGTLTPEDELLTVKLLLQGRHSAQVASSTAKGGRKTAAKLANLDGDALLEEMLGGD